MIVIVFITIVTIIISVKTVIVTIIVMSIAIKNKESYEERGNVWVVVMLFLAGSQARACDSRRVKRVLDRQRARRRHKRCIEYSNEYVCLNTHAPHKAPDRARSLT